jgi:nodulation protein E
VKRVVITGAGTINPLGHSVPPRFEAMREGRCGSESWRSATSTGCRSASAGRCAGYEAETEHFNRQQIALYDRFTQFTLLAAREAIAQSGSEFRPAWPNRAGVVLGTSGGGLNTQDENYRPSTRRARTASIPSSCPS